MKKINLFLLFSGLLAGCSTDFETIAPWKETMVVYGLLNPNDSIQYIRISKAYLGEGNAIVMAQEADSIYYTDSLEVKMERFEGSSLLESHALIRCDSSEVPKENGTFSAPYQAVYKYIYSLHPSANDDNSVYKLTVTNRSSGNVVTASAKMIENFPINAPNAVSAYKFNSPSGQTWKLISSKRGRIYGITQKIKYWEVNTLTHDSVEKIIDWYLGDKLTVSPEVEAEIRFPFASLDLYRLLGGNIAIDANKTRRLDAIPIDVYVSAGSEELYTYMQVTDQNTGITQDKPLYTNIENGIGLFTCRNTRKIGIHLHPETYNALDTSQYTKYLNFLH